MSTQAAGRSLSSGLAGGLVCLLVALTSAWPRASAAHKINSSYTSVFVRADSLVVILALDESDLSSFCVDRNADGVLWREEILAGADSVYAFLESGIAIVADGVPATLVRGEHSLNVDGDGNLFLETRFRSTLPAAPAILELDMDFLVHMDPSHRNLAKVRVYGSPPQPAVFSRDNRHHRFVLKEPSLLERVLEFTELGVEHIFLGYDHIMFLLALIIMGGRLGLLVKIVSAFTVAHSITLILAALEIVTLPGRLIESAIAFSIAYVAAENFWVRKLEHRWILTFFFGLVHGFGFANVLRELGLPSKGLIASLLAFNIGVEIGQIVIVSLLFPVVIAVGRSRYRTGTIKAVSAFILLFGLGWLIERVLDLSYMPL